MLSPAVSLHLEEFPRRLLWNEVIFHGRWASAQQGQKRQLSVISSTNITPPFLFVWCGFLLSAASSVARFLSGGWTQHLYTGYFDPNFADASP